jgi:hypothetical protein
MRFRALNFDYHAEAELLIERQRHSRDDNSCKPYCILLLDGSGDRIASSSQGKQQGATYNDSMQPLIKLADRPSLNEESTGNAALGAEIRVNEDISRESLLREKQTASPATAEFLAPKAKSTPLCSDDLLISRAHPLQLTNEPWDESLRIQARNKQNPRQSTDTELLLQNRLRNSVRSENSRVYRHLEPPTDAGAAFDQNGQAGGRRDGFSAEIVRVAQRNLCSGSFPMAACFFSFSPLRDWSVLFAVVARKASSFEGDPKTSYPRIGQHCATECAGERELNESTIESIVLPRKRRLSPAVLGSSIHSHPLTKRGRTSTVSFSCFDLLQLNKKQTIALNPNIEMISDQDDILSQITSPSRIDGKQEAIASTLSAIRNADIAHSKRKSREEKSAKRKRKDEKRRVAKKRKHSSDDKKDAESKSLKACDESGFTGENRISSSRPNLKFNAVDVNDELRRTRNTLMSAQKSRNHSSLAQQQGASRLKASFRVTEKPHHPHSQQVSRSAGVSNNANGEKATQAAIGSVPAQGKGLRFEPAGGPPFAQDTGDGANPIRAANVIEKPLKLLCSESFLESWGESVTELASGRWAHTSPTDNTYGVGSFAKSKIAGVSKIVLIDSPLVKKCGIDIEAPGRCGIIVLEASSLESVSLAKKNVRDIAGLAAVGRYVQLHIFICHNLLVSPATSKHAVHLQNAVASFGAAPQTHVIVKTVSLCSLSMSLAQTILSRPKVQHNVQLLEEATAAQAATDVQLQERALFILSLIPVLSVNGAVHCCLLAQHNLPQGNPYFELLFKNQWLRQQITLITTSEEKGTDVHPSAMELLTHASNVDTGLISPLGVSKDEHGVANARFPAEMQSEVAD